MKRKSLKINAFLNGLKTFLNFLFPLITFPYVSRVLSVEEIGKYNFSNSLISYFLLLAALGIDKYAIREGAKYRDNKEKFSSFASEIFQIYVNSDTTMLGYLKNDYSVGIYSVATKIYLIMKNLTGSILTVTIPRLAYLASKKTKEDYEKLLSKVANALIILIIPSIVGVILLSREAVLIIAGNKYLDAQLPLIILSVAILFSTFSGLFNNCVLLPYKREKVFLKSSIISAIANIVLNLILIPYFGSVGAAFTTLISESIMASMNFFGCKDLIGKVIFNKPLKDSVVSVFCGSIGIIICCRIIKNLFSNLYVYSVTSVLLSVIIYGCILVLLKNEIVLENMKKIMHKRNRFSE